MILFDQIGVDNRSVNPYYTVVFVYFVMSVVCLGIVIVLLPFICCAMCCILAKDDAADAAKTQEAIDNLKNTLESTQAPKRSKRAMNQ